MGSCSPARDLLVSPNLSPNLFVVSMSGSRCSPAPFPNQPGDERREKLKGDKKKPRGLPLKTHSVPSRCLPSVWRMVLGCFWGGRALPENPPKERRRNRGGLRAPAFSLKLPLETSRCAWEMVSGLWGGFIPPKSWFLGRAGDFFPPQLFFGVWWRFSPSWKLVSGVSW